MTGFYGNVDISQQIEKGRTKTIGTFDPKVLEDWVKSLKSETKKPVEILMIESEYPQHAIAAREVGSSGEYLCVCPVVIQEEEDNGLPC